MNKEKLTGLEDFYDKLNSRASVLGLRYYHELHGPGGSSDPIRPYSRNSKSFTPRELSEMESLVQEYKDIVQEFIFLESLYANFAEAGDEEAKEMQSEVRMTIGELTKENLNREVNLRVLQEKSPFTQLRKKL